MSTAALQPQATEVPSVNGVQIIAPDGYHIGDVLPIYKAQMRTEENTAFFSLDPATFNTSGIAQVRNRTGSTIGTGYYMRIDAMYPV